jgi:hypothetical protein
MMAELIIGFVRKNQQLFDEMNRVPRHNWRSFPKAMAKLQVGPPELIEAALKAIEADSGNELL